MVAMYTQVQTNARRAFSIDDTAAYQSEFCHSSIPQTSISNFSTDSLDQIDNPPTPERIRNFGKQLKRSSFRDRHLSQQTISSKSSSLLSITSESPSWELGPDIISSRRSSQRSSSSSNPSREPPENSLPFGKGIFNRRAKGSRDVSDAKPQNSLSLMPSASDLKSSSIMSNMFARRKGSRSDIEPLEQKKLQISGPYNFQHLTHTQKASVPDLDRTSRMDLVSEFASMRAGQKPSIGSLKGIHAAQIQSPDPASESYSFQAELSPRVVQENQVDVAGQPDSRHRPGSRPGSSRDKDLPATPGEVWMRKHSHSVSHDIAKVPPPRPARSPAESSFPSPIPPPPRKSSRGSMRFDGFDPVITTTLDRPTTGGSFRSPQPPHSAQEQAQLPANGIAQEDALWPLTPPAAMSSLPEVPEEDEAQQGVRKSLISAHGNHSSLKGSVSVPLLRQISLSQRSQRPPSNASDTLGQFNTVYIQQRAEAASSGTPLGEIFLHGDWEDDIDYCYEHEAEADCDYAWERPSTEMWRNEDCLTHFVREEQPTLFTDTFGAANSQKANYSGARAVSPCSPTSPKSKPKGHAPSKSSLTLPITNFSLPDRGHNRTLSRASTNIETQEFTLSPSLLIPNDYQQQMLNYEREANRIQGIEEDEPLGHLYDKSALMLKVRSSSSTTASTYSEHSLASSRHKSSLSTSTAFTRWTGISSTGSVDCWQQQGETHFEAPPALTEQDEFNTTPTADVVGMTLPETNDSAAKLASAAGHRHRTASEANILAKFTSDDGAEKSHTEPQSLRTRRRARTTSRSHNAPPNLGLFPHVPDSPRF